MRKALSIWVRRVEMSPETIGVIVNGVTGRMGYRQHLVRSLLAIRDEGGVAAADGTRIWPEPVLVGRDPDRLAEIAAPHGLTDWTTHVDAAPARDDLPIYFAALATNL